MHSLLSAPPPPLFVHLACHQLYCCCKPASDTQTLPVEPDSRCFQAPDWLTRLSSQFNPWNTDQIVQEFFLEMHQYKTFKKKNKQNLFNVANWIASSWGWSPRKTEWVYLNIRVLPRRSVLRPVIHSPQLHSKMSNGCLMGVSEASINLIADHWVNFSYLENPSFPKCCECGGIWRKSVSKDKGVVSLKYSLALRDNLYGIYWSLQWW